MKITCTDPTAPRRRSPLPWLPTLRAGLLAAGVAACCACAAVPPARDDTSGLQLRGTRPDGSPFALELAAGGWRFATEGAMRRVGTAAPAGDEPLNVMVDGPTGFVFVWPRDEGWRFVGTLGRARS